MSRVSIRYAKALFSLALEEKKLDRIANDLKEIETLIEVNNQFSNFISSPLISSVKHIELVKNIFPGKVDVLTINFLELISKKKRFNRLPGILIAFNELLLRHHNQLHAEITSAVPLDDQQLDAIKSNLEAMTSKSIILNTKEDKKLIGGFKVMVEGLIIDNSVQYQLWKLKEKLVS